MRPNEEKTFAMLYSLLILVLILVVFAALVLVEILSAAYGSEITFYQVKNSFIKPTDNYTRDFFSKAISALRSLNFKNLLMQVI
jgi:hypothetical protein